MSYDEFAQSRASKVFSRLFVTDMVDKYAPRGTMLLIAGPGAPEVPLYAGRRKVLAVDTDWECLMDAHRNGANDLWWGRISQVRSFKLAAAHIDLFSPPCASLVRELSPFFASKPFKRGAVLTTTYIRARVKGVKGEENYKLMLRGLLDLMEVPVASQLGYYSYKNGSTGKYPMGTLAFQLR
jgi:hypothetical protein